MGACCLGTILVYIAAGAVKGAHKVGKERGTRQERHVAVLDYLEQVWPQAINRDKELLISLSSQVHKAEVCWRISSSLPGALEDDPATLQEKKKGPGKYARSGSI